MTMICHKNTLISLQTCSKVELAKVAPTFLSHSSIETTHPKIFPRNSCACVDNVHSTFNFKSKVSRDGFENKQRMLIDICIFFQNVTCLVVRAISISNVSIDVWFVTSQVPLAYLSNPKLCVSIHMYICF